MRSEFSSTCGHGPGVKTTFSITFGESDQDRRPEFCAACGRAAGILLEFDPL